MRNYESCVILLTMRAWPGAEAAGLSSNARSSGLRGHQVVFRRRCSLAGLGLPSGGMWRDAQGAFQDRRVEEGGKGNVAVDAVAGAVPCAARAIGCAPPIAGGDQWRVILYLDSSVAVIDDAALA